MTVATRSGGDTMRKQECREPLMQAFDEKSSKLQQFRNAKMANKIDRHGVGEADWIESLQECPVYYPSKEDFAEDPLRYIQKISEGASKYGMCKIVSPVLASMPAGMVLSKEQSGFRFPARLQPMRISNWEKDDKIAFPIKGRHYTLTEYEKVANRVFSRKFSTAAALPPRFIESEFWKELVGGKTRTVEYATDVDGSAFSTSKSDPLGQSKWNLKGISKLPESTLRLLEETIPGVTEPMLYIGMLFSMFAWHIEDHYLYSINYQHCGAPKTWYGVPGDAAVHFEKVVKEHVYSRELLNDAGKGAELDLLLEKTTMFAPKLLKDHGVPVFRAVQYPGEFIITFPRAYHAGFSHGFNCGEAVNFAMVDWFPFGAEACLRYEFLNRQPLLPHDELLCKEAMTIGRMDQISPKHSLCKQKACALMAFVALMQFHRQVKSTLERQGAKTTTSTFCAVFCGLCKHKCYAAYTHCKCLPEPTCFNHGDFFGGCSCEGDRMIFLRDDFSNLQVAAQKYEREEEIRKQAQKLCLDKDTAEQGDGAPFRGVSESIESSLLTNAASSREACENREDREDACSRNILFNSETCRAFAISDCTQAQEEEEEASDTEVLRIKRRRVAYPQSKRFQVDEQEIAQVKYAVRSLDCGNSSPMRGCEGLDKQEHARSDKQEHSKGASVMKGDRNSVCQAIGELNIRSSAAEVVSQWRSDQGMILKVEEVGQESARVLSVKSHDKRENSKAERTLPCMILNVTPPQLTETTGDLSSPGELHSDSDEKRSAETKSRADLGALSSITGSTILNGEIATQEVQDVKGNGASVNDEDAEGAAEIVFPDVLCDPESTRVDGGKIKKEECSSSEAASTEPEPSVLLTDLVAEIPIATAVNEIVERDDSSAAGGPQTCKPVMSHVDNADMGNGERRGKALPDEGRLFCVDEVSNLCDKSSQALGAGNILHDAPHMIWEAFNAKSSNDCDKAEATTSSSREPKRGLIIHLNRKVEQPPKKAATLFHDQNKSEIEYDQVDIFEGQPGAAAWCLDEEMGFCSIVSNGGESTCPLEYLTSMSGDNILQHRVECEDAQECFAGSFDMKAEIFSGGECSMAGLPHGKSDDLQAGNEFPLLLEPNSQLMSPEEEDHSGALESINALSCREDVLPAACGKQQQAELCRELTNEILEELPAGVRTSVGNNAQLYDIGLDVHAPRFRHGSHYRREAFGNNFVDKFSYKTQTYGWVKSDPYIGQSTHWGCPPQGCYDFSSNLPTGQTASRNNSDRYKHISRRSSSVLHQGHHPYQGDTHRFRKYRPVFRDKEQVPCGYWKRRPNRNNNGGWRDARSNNTLGVERRPIERVIDRQVAGCSSSTSEGSGYVEGYDPVKWEISPSGNHGQLSHSYHHVPSSRAGREC